MKKRPGSRRQPSASHFFDRVRLLTEASGQLVTGSCVNLVLVVAALLGGVWSA